MVKVLRVPVALAKSLSSPAPQSSYSNCLELQFQGCGTSGLIPVLMCVHMGTHVYVHT